MHLLSSRHSASSILNSSSPSNSLHDWKLNQNLGKEYALSRQPGKVHAIPHRTRELLPVLSMDLPDMDMAYSCSIYRKTISREWAMVLFTWSFVRNKKRIFCRIRLVLDQEECCRQNCQRCHTVFASQGPREFHRLKSKHESVRGRSQKKKSAREPL